MAVATLTSGRSTGAVERSQPCGQLLVSISFPGAEGVPRVNQKLKDKDIDNNFVSGKDIDNNFVSIFFPGAEGVPFMA